MASEEVSVNANLFQAPIRTPGHQTIRIAALLGACFVVSHLVTIAITCVVEGFNWGFNAWMADIMGFLAGFFFAVQCWLSSSRKSVDFRSANFWICFWAIATLIFRIIDTLMLFGIIKWSAVYITPEGPTLWTNIASEVIIGNAFAIAALAGSLLLLKRSNAESAQTDVDSV